MKIRFMRRWLPGLLPALILAAVVLAMPTASPAQIGVAISFGPPAIPIYEQPICPGDGYLWVPGYWAYDYDFGDYYWVPGTWILAPEIGFLWTPGWWGWEGGRFFWHEGFWGPHIGFYGGINYGFGYFGFGFDGGRWEGGHFFYNRAVVNVNVTEIRNVYNTTIVNNNVNRVSFNGGNGGVVARPRPEEEAAARDRHIAAVAAQTEHIQAARNNPQMRASNNMGRPAIAATARPGEFSGRGVVAAREAGGEYHPPARTENRPENRATGGGGSVHPHDLAPIEKMPPPNTGNAKQDRKYQQDQDKLFAKQNQEREKLQQQQEKEHQQLAKQHASQERQQQVEQRHQQQTQQMQQKHEQQRQQMQQRTQPRPPKK